MKRVIGETWSKVCLEWHTSDRDKSKKAYAVTILIRGNRVQILYEGQRVTCYRCNEPGHQHQDCPLSKSTGRPHSETITNAFANILSQGHRVKRPDGKKKDTSDVQGETYEANNAEDSTYLMKGTISISSRTKNTHRTGDFLETCRNSKEG